MKLRDFVWTSANAIQVCFEWNMGYAQNMCIDFMTSDSMRLLDDDDFDKFVECDGCPFTDLVEEQMVGTNLGDGIKFEKEDMNNITHWFVNPSEDVYIAIVEC